jgi:cytochrome c oxidase subunit 1
VIITAHGLIMVFFVVMPATFGGFGNWFVPLMIGAPDMAFPADEQCQLLAAGAVRFCCCSCRPSSARRGVNGAGAGVGWTIYARCPGASPAGTRARRSTWRSSRCILAGASSIMSSINFITTIFNMRAPGMTLAPHAALRLVDPGDGVLLLLWHCRSWPARSRCC